VHSLRRSTAPRGQSTVELVGLVGLVAALALSGALLARSGLPAVVAGALRAALGGGPTPRTLDEASPLTRRLVAAALQGGAGAPTMHDARVLLAAELGAPAAAAELERLARARYAGAAETALGVAAVDVHRVAARLVTADDDAAIAAALRGIREDAILAAGVQAALGAAAAIDVAAGLASGATSALWAARARRPGARIPPGAEDGDVVLCLDLDAPWRDLDPALLPSRRGARVALIPAPPPGRTRAAARVVVRGGAVIARALDVGHACR